MITWLLLAVCSRYDALVQAALQDSRRPRLQQAQPLYTPGEYTEDGISFRLSRSLFSAEYSEIKGHAADHEYLAFATSASLDAHPAVFSTNDTLVALRDRVHAQQGVQIYKYESINPLAVFTDIHIASALNPEFDCSIGKGAAAYCKAGVSYNWPQTGSNESQYRNISDTPVQYKAAFLGSLIGSVDLKIHGFDKLYLDFDLQADAALDLGIKVPAFNMGLGSYDIELLTIPIYSKQIKFCSYRLGVSFDATLNFVVNDLNLNFTEEFTYERNYKLGANFDARLSPSGFSCSPPLYNIAQYGTNLSVEDALLEYSEHIKLEATPGIRLGVEASVGLGKTGLGPIKAGLTYAQSWDFSANAEKCTVPYLYGSSQHKVSLDFSSTVGEIFGWELVEAFDYSFDLYTGRRSVPSCIFSPAASSEGLDSNKIDREERTVIVHPWKVHPNSDGVDKDPKFYLKLKAKGSEFSKSLSLPALSFAPGDKGSDIKYPQRIMVLKDFPSDLQFQYSAKEIDTVFSDKFTIPTKFSLGDHDADKICYTYDEYWIFGGHNGICIYTQFDDIMFIEPHKEFSLHGLNYTGFKTYGNSGDQFSLIIHSNETDYQVLNCGILDTTTTSLESLPSGVYTNRLDLNISFGWIKVKKAGNATITFAMGSEDVASIIVYNDEISGSGNFTSSGQDVIISYSQSSLPLSVNATFDGTTVTKTYSHSELSNGITIEAPDVFSLSLDVEPIQSEVIFKLPEHVDNAMGIVSHVFSAGRIALSAGEQYGILAIDSPEDTHLLKIHDIVPLTDYQIIDDEHMVIVHDYTVDGTTYIPFRALNNSGYTVEYEVMYSFASNGAPICSKNATIEAGTSEYIGCVEISENISPYWDYGMTDVSCSLIPISNNSQLHYCHHLSSSNAATSNDSYSVTLTPTEYEFANKQSELFIDGSELYGQDIYVRCSICDTIDAANTADGTNSVAIQQVSAKVWKLSPPPGESLFVSAYCNSNNASFCRITEEFDVDTSYLVTYQAIAGITDWNWVNGTKLYNSIMKQLVQNRSNVVITKNWEGPITKQVIPSSGPIEISVELGDVVTVSASISGTSIPFSVSSYIRDPTAFMQALGAQKSTDFYPGDVSFTPEGTVQINSTLFNSSNFNTTANLFDISYSSAQVIYVHPGSSTSSTGTITTVFIVIGAVAAVVLAAVGTFFFVKWRRSNTNEADAVTFYNLMV